MVFKDEATSALYKRIIHRFCNMMSAETVRKFKRVNQLKKSSALRQGLQAKSEKKQKKSAENVPIASIITDPFQRLLQTFHLRH